MHFWDFKSGFCFQKEHPPPQPGSIDSERGIFALCFDKSGSRLITAEADKSIKMWKEDPEAVSFLEKIMEFFYFTSFQKILDFIFNTKILSRPRKHIHSHGVRKF